MSLKSNKIVYVPFGFFFVGKSMFFFILEYCLDKSYVFKWFSPCFSYFHFFLAFSPTCHHFLHINSFASIFLRLSPPRLFFFDVARLLLDFASTCPWLFLGCSLNCLLLFSFLDYFLFIWYKEYVVKYVMIHDHDVLSAFSPYSTVFCWTFCFCSHVGPIWWKQSKKNFKTILQLFWLDLIET